MPRLKQQPMPCPLANCPQDFANHNAFHLLERYRPQLACFNGGLVMRRGMYQLCVPCCPGIHSAAEKMVGLLTLILL